VCFLGDLSMYPAEPLCVSFGFTWQESKLENLNVHRRSVF
jgi:hypothetical protein